MTVIEAMAAGVPTVATRAGGLADLVTDSTGILVNIGDDVAMAAAIERLLQNGELRRSMGCQARAVAEGRFRASGVAARYRQLYFDMARLGH
jgi:glycosyltransferase involved in cell wall biosynthesis